LYTRIVAGMEAGLVADAQRTWPAARAFSPTLFGGLPRFFEKAYTALREARDASDGDVRAAWTRLESVGARRAAMRRAGEAVPSEMEAEWQGAHAPAAAVLASLFGGRLRLATSGGAPLPIEVATSLDTLGLTVLGAYGQTEHLCVAFHRPNDYAFDSVGRPMPGTELQIADDGEVLVRRGALTFSGYWNKPAATREAFTEDGAWLRTGDLGSLDAAGRLVITGRKKEILALSTGKKVAPLPIEARLVAHPSVAHAVVVGEGQRFVGALLFLRPDVASDEASLDVHVADLNAALAPHEQVRRWRAVPHELSEAAGELTPTLKAKRAVIAARYADLIESLYA
jgi:long-chain acyl-CoA synthetase